MGTFNDLIIELGFSTKNAERGLDHLEKMIDKAGKRQASISRKHSEKSAKESAKVFEKMFSEKEKYARQHNRELVKAQNRIKKSAKESADVYKQMFSEKEKHAEKHNKEQVKAQDKLKKSAKESADVYKQMFSEKEKYAEKYNREQVKAQNRIKKSAKESAKFFEKELAEREKSVKKQKLDNTLKQENVRLSKILLAVSGKEANVNKTLPLQKQNALIEKQIKLYRTRNMRADNQEFTIKSRSHFKNLPAAKQKELQSRFNQAKAEFRVEGDTRVFKILNEDIKNFKKNLTGLKTVQNGVTDSTRNMVRSYASLFALVEGSRALEQAGIAAQGMEVAMLSSSGSAKKAGEDLGFINALADKTGNDLKSMTDSYVKMQFAMKGKIPDDQFKTFFTNTNKLFTSLKLTKEQAKLAGKALQQMANKNQVMSEELKGQLAESLPGAVQIFANALDVPTEKLFDMMQKGQVNFQKILPQLSEQFRKVAEDGGAYKAALKSLIVTKGQFGNESFRAQTKVFKSGFEEGMSELYKTMTEELETTGKSQEDLGNIYKNFFKLIAQGIRLAVPLIEALVQSVSKMSDAVQLSIDGWKLIYKDVFLPLPDVIKGATLAIAGLSLAMKSVIAQGVLLLATFQEIASLFDDKLVGVLEARLGSQFNLKTMQQTKLVEKDGNYFSEGKPADMFSTAEGKGVAVAGAAASVAAGIFAIKKLVGGFTAANTAVRKFASVVNRSANTMDSGKSGKSKGKSKSSIPFGAIGAVAPALLAAPVAYSAYQTNENRDDILAGARSGEIGSRAQRALQRADEAFKSNPSNIANQMKTQAQMQSSRTNYVTLSPEINVNIDGSNMNTEDAGMKIANTAIESLEAQLSTVMKRGRN